MDQPLWTPPQQLIEEPSTPTPLQNTPALYSFRGTQKIVRFLANGSPMRPHSIYTKVGPVPAQNFKEAEAKLSAEAEKRSASVKRQMMLDGVISAFTREGQHVANMKWKYEGPTPAKGETHDSNLRLRVHDSQRGFRHGVAGNRR